MNITCELEDSHSCALSPVISALGVDWAKLPSRTSKLREKESRTVWAAVGCEFVTTASTSLSAWLAHAML